jgi:DGQHR domain-containing protein
LRSVDGQHRRRGIKQAIDALESIGSHHTALLIYVEDDLAKRRQMFSDMNNTPRKVSRAINVAFDSRDPFARVAKRLAVEHPLLDGHVESQAARVRAGSPHYYTLGAVHDATKRLFVGPNGRVKDASKYNGDAIYGCAWDFFELLSTTRPEFAQAKDPVALDHLRKTTLLFSSTTLRVMAGTIYALLGAGAKADRMGAISRPLSHVDFSPSAKIWVDSGFVSPGKATPNARTQELLSATDALVAELKRYSQPSLGERNE